MLSDLLDLFFPRQCVCCQELLLHHEKLLCDPCWQQLPKTNFAEELNNPVISLFRGRAELHHASALYSFRPKSKIQKLIHSFKYHGNTNLAFALGQEMGKQICKSKLFGQIDLIVPVPLHPKKQRKRGYNQAEILAAGMAKEMCVDLNPELLIRAKMNSTQTNKSAAERWQNVEGIFQFGEPKASYGKHVLIVDDVITTGSTLESCAQEILKAEGNKVSVACLAWAEH